MLDAPQAMLDERHRLDLDKQDEMWDGVLHPEGRRFELFRRFDDRLMLMSPDASGAVESEVLGIRLATVEGALRVTWPGGSADL